MVVKGTKQTTLHSILHLPKSNVYNPSRTLKKKKKKKPFTAYGARNQDRGTNPISFARWPSGTPWPVKHFGLLHASWTSI